MNNIEICALQLPGRESRLSENRITSMSELVPLLAEQIEPLMTVPSFFFGHSMGGLIAFELSKYLRAKGSSMPKHLFVSASKAPQLPMRRPGLHSMSDIELLKEMSRYGGTPREVLEDKDMIAMMIPLIRADCTIFETCDYLPESPLECPISVFGSSEDDGVNEDELRGWQEQTSLEFNLELFPGGHFFLKNVEQRNKMLAKMSRVIQAIGD